MSLLDPLARWIPLPRLSRARVAVALAAAVVADGLQLVLGPLGWVGIDEAIDVVLMIVESWLLGFHLFFLPTFVVEFLPVADMLPTWTGCVAVVAALRSRDGKAEGVGKVPPPVITVSEEEERPKGLPPVR